MPVRMYVCMYVCMYEYMCLYEVSTGDVGMNTHQSTGDVGSNGDIPV